QEDELPGRVAKSYSERPGESIADQQKQIALLTEQRLTPIAKLLAGEGTHPRVKRLIVLPSPALANVPVETLLSDKEDITVSYAPSGTIFTWLREKARSDSAPSMLALADPA